MAGQLTHNPDVPVVTQVTPRAGRNLPAAIAVGLGLGGLIALSLLLYRPAFMIVVLAAVGLGVVELCTALKVAHVRAPLVPLLAGAAAMILGAWFRGPDGLVAAFAMTLLAVGIWRMIDGPNGFGRDVMAGALVAMYVPFLAGFAVLLAHPSDGAGRVIAYVATVVCSDVGGYAVGVLIGRHPMAPLVSPKKSWEGFSGSAVSCCVCGALLFQFLFHDQWWHGVLFGLAIVVTATVGDLGESMIKRDIGVKDMGNLLPGHGGVMDRLDSLLPSAAVAYLMLALFSI